MKCIRYYSYMTYPLEEFLKKNWEYEWAKECYAPFNTLKKKLVEATIFWFLNRSVKIHVHIDTSNIAINAILTQPRDDEINYLIVYSIRKLNKAEHNYSMTEREALWMVFALQKYRHCLLANPFVFYTDHQELKYLVKKPQHHGIICCWLLLFQELDLKS